MTRFSLVGLSLALIATGCVRGGACCRPRAAIPQAVRATEVQAPARAGPSPVEAKAKAKGPRAANAWRSTGRRATSAWKSATTTRGLKSDAGLVQSVLKGRPRGAAGPTVRNRDLDAPTTYAVINMEFADAESRSAFDVAGVTVFSAVERFADAFVPVGAEWAAVWEQVRAAPGLVWFEIDVEALVPPVPHPTTNEVRSKAPPERIARGGVSGLTGKGVVIAIVDSGIDFRHPDFVEERDGIKHSRLLYLWDTTRQPEELGVGVAAPIRYPNGEPIGTILDSATLDRELRVPTIHDLDENGHGTGCAGIAAGSGRASGGEHAGVAPGADLIAVRVGSGAGGGIRNGYLLGAVCDWLFGVAGDRPLVVSCSFGGHYGGHDGALVAERSIDARFGVDVVGRAICISAGNEGYDGIHAVLTIGEGAEDAEDAEDGVLYVGRGEEWEGEWIVDVWVDTEDTEEEWKCTFDGDLDVTALESDYHPLQKQVRIQCTLEGEGGMLLLRSESGRRYSADAYVRLGPDAGWFYEESADPRATVGTPGTTSNAITVGSYDWNDSFETSEGLMTLNVLASDEYRAMTTGALSAYSSRGPQRTERVVKPDIVAPGQYFAAPSSADRDPERDLVRHSTDRYRLFNGTSAATPYVAGVLALLFERHPRMTLGEVKSALRRWATRDDHTGRVPNHDWGFGKLDYAAVRRLLAGP